MREIVVIGGGGHAKVLISTLKKLGHYSIIGYTDPTNNGSLLGVHYLGDDSVLPDLCNKHSSCSAAIGVGAVAATDARQRIAAVVESAGFMLPPIVSPHAVVNEGVPLGKGTVVFDGAVVQPGCVIGDGVIINTNSTIEHDCRIDDYAHIASGAVLSGGVSVGKFSMIGAGATVRQSCSVCSGCTVGAGAAVVHDCLQPGIYYGVPARKKS